MEFETKQTTFMSKEKPSEKEIQDFIERALYEDIREGDHTSLACIPADARTKAKLLVKDDGVLAGIELAKSIFKKVDPTATVEVKIQDGMIRVKGSLVL